MMTMGGDTNPKNIRFENSRVHQESASENSISLLAQQNVIERKYLQNISNYSESGEKLSR